MRAEIDTVPDEPTGTPPPRTGDDEDAGDRLDRLRHELDVANDQHPVWRETP